MFLFLRKMHENCNKTVSCKIRRGQEYYRFVKNYFYVIRNRGLHEFGIESVKTDQIEFRIVEEEAM